MIIYLARPIDNAPPSFRHRSAKRLAELGATLFDPHTAWQPGTEHDQRLFDIDLDVVGRVDGVAVDCPGHISSVGVWREVQHAVSLGVPVHWVQDGSTKPWALADVDTGPVEAWYHRLERRPSADGPVVFEKLDGGLPDPGRGYSDDVGIDMYTAADTEVRPGEVANIPCGVAVALPPRCWALIHGRSSALRLGLLVHSGVIDPGYRGPLYAVVTTTNAEPVLVEKGRRIAQLIPVWAAWPPIAIGKVDVLTARGARGFGSTGG